MSEWSYKDIKKVLRWSELHRKFLKKLAEIAYWKEHAQRHGHKQSLRTNGETKRSS